LIEVSNAGLKLREPAKGSSASGMPVIGDELDQATYGRPAGQAEHAARERRVAPSRRNASPRRKPSSPAYDSGRSRIDEAGVRTVKIRGQATPARRRAQNLYERPMARYDQHPDRAAQWALFLGVFMVVVAIVTGT
jgi:hypothetical protein